MSQTEPVRLDPRWSPEGVQDVPEDWDLFLDGEIGYEDLDDEDKARARRFGFA